MLPLEPKDGSRTPFATALWGNLTLSPHIPFTQSAEKAGIAPEYFPSLHHLNVEKQKNLSSGNLNCFQHILSISTERFKT